MIKHIVLHRVRANVPEEKVQEVYAEIEGLQDKIPGIVSFTGGPNCCIEGWSKGFTHGFIMEFKDQESRDVYRDHPEHEKVKQKMFSLIDGGREGVLKLDIEASGPDSIA